MISTVVHTAAVNEVVPKRGNYILFNKNYITNRAMLTFGKTGSGTSCRYCSVNNLGVTKGCLFGIGGVITS